MQMCPIQKTKLKELLGVLCIVNRTIFLLFKAVFTLWKLPTLEAWSLEMHHFQD